MAENSKIDRHIGEHPTDAMYQSGQEIDCACARCGSSCYWLECFSCDEGYLGSDCIDDLCHGGVCIHGDSGEIACDICRGEGGGQVCGASADWCKANPLPGREDVHGEIEWFTVPEVATP